MKYQESLELYGTTGRLQAHYEMLDSLITVCKLEGCSKHMLEYEITIMKDIIREIRELADQCEE